VGEETEFDCLAEGGDDELDPRPRAEVPKPLEVALFRRHYLFRRLNASPTSYLQCLTSLAPFLLGVQEPDLSNRYYAHIYKAIWHGLSGKMIEESNPPQSFIYSGTNDLDVDVGVFSEFLTTGESETQEAQRKAQHLAKLGLKGLDENSELMKKLEELENQTVEIDCEPLDIGEFGTTLWSLSEENLAGLLPFMSGDMSLLDFPYESE